jgi:hypothetical protein
MIKLPSYLTGFSSRSDGSASVRFATQELSGDEFSQLKDHHNAYGWLVFKENEIKPEDIPTEDVEDKNKTPSKRLRATLYVLAQQQGVPKEKFEEFYREKMEKLIDHVKAKLDQ